MKNKIDKRLSKVITHIQNNQDDEALNVINKLINKTPNNPLFLNIKGFIYLKNKNYLDAKPYFEKSLLLKPDFIDAIKNLAICFRSLNDIEKTIFWLEKINEIEPNNLFALKNRAEIEFQSGYYKNAEEKYIKLIDLEGIDDNYIYALTNIHIELNEIVKARTILEKINSKNENFYNLIGVLDSYINDLESAKKNFLRSIEINYRYLKPYYNLVTLTDYSLETKQISTIKSLIESTSNILENSLAYFTLYEHFEKNNDPIKAYDYLDKANSCEFDSSLFDINNIEAKQKIIFELFEKVKSKNFKVNLSQKKLIFIVGMPRCGSTMLEQILSRHEEIHPLGETSIFPMIYSQLENDFIKNENHELLIERFRRNYFDRVEQYTDKKILIDKSLLNFKWLGLISIFFPESKIINLNRDPISTFFSCYKTKFISKTFNFTNNLNTLLEFHNYYKKTIKVWGNENLNNFIECDYELIVQNPEIKVREIFNFLNIEFNQDFLNIHLSKNPIKTASLNQARKKISNASIPKWEQYPKFITDFEKLKSSNDQ